MILDFSFRQVMKLSTIKRWGVVDMSKEQSVAEHSYNVAMISLMIVNQLPGPPHAGLKESVLSWALAHDLPEQMTSDIPTPVKLELVDAISGMESRMFPLLAHLKSDTSLLAKTIVKMADIIDAIQFIDRFCIDRDKSSLIMEMTERLKEVINNAPLGFPVHLAKIEGEIWTDAKTS